jgi:radical SAM-linked protein
LPSLRCNERSIHIAQYINRSKRPTLTFAPEAGTDRLRNVIGKYLSEKQILNTLLSANKMGWDTVKLYFMIGLPTETQEDIEAIDKLLRLTKENAKSLNFTITVSPFVPKAQTAFQWHSMLDSEKIKEKIEWLKANVNADVKAHNHRASVFEAFIAKGDRRISATIYKAWQKGAKFDQWADKFNTDIWDEALKESGIDLNFYVYRERTAEEIFAWEHLNFGVTKKELYDQFIKGINEKADADTTAFSQSQSELPQDYKEPSLEYIEPQMRLKLRFSRRGAVSFLSHLEQIEVLRRIVRRAGLPLAFTGGFSPQVKSSYSQPVSVGQESDSEYMELFLIEKVDIEEAKEKISKVLPNGFFLLDIKRVPLLFPSLDSLINVMEFKIYDTDKTHSDINSFLSQEKIIITKYKKGQTKEIDIKPFIKFLKIKGSVLTLLLKFDRNVFIKPEMVLNELYKNQQWHNLPIKRTNLYIETPDNILHTA